MPSKIRHGLLISMTVVALLFASIILSYAETVNYFYDDLHRLIRVEYGSGVSIQYTYDQFGNRTQETIRDIGAPTTTASPPGGCYNAAQTVTLTCSDGNGVGCDKIYYTTDGSTPNTSSPVYASPINISVPTTLKFFSRDLAGNIEPVQTQVYTIDVTPPTGTITINSGAPFTTTINVTLTLSCNDTNGCSQMGFSNDGSTYSTSEAYSTTKAWTLALGDGTKTVYVRFEDAAGNWSTPYSDTIILDATAPTTTAAPPGGSYNSAQSVTLSCSDGTGLGCDKIYYTTDGSTPTTVYTSPINISSTTTLKFFAKDVVGNSESIRTEIYSIDMIPPTGTITIDGGATFAVSTTVALTLSCGDNVGCSEMQFSNDNINYSTPEAYGTTKAWALASGNGTKTVYVKFKDLAGNWSSTYSDTIILNSSCSNSPVKIGSVSFSTLQAAYDSAVNGSVIKCIGIRSIQNLTVNRNITVTLEGGYDCGYTTNYGNMTVIKGMITTTAGGGTITIKNFILEK